MNTRFRRWAQVIAMDGMYAGFAGAKTGHGRMTPNWRLLILAIGAFGPAILGDRSFLLTQKASDPLLIPTWALHDRPFVKFGI